MCISLILGEKRYINFLNPNHPLEHIIIKSMGACNVDLRSVGKVILVESILQEKEKTESHFNILNLVIDENTFICDAY